MENNYINGFVSYPLFLFSFFLILFLSPSPALSPLLSFPVSFFPLLHLLHLSFFSNHTHLQSLELILRKKTSKFAIFLPHPSSSLPSLSNLSFIMCFLGENSCLSWGRRREVEVKCFPSLRSVLCKCCVVLGVVVLSPRIGIGCVAKMGFVLLRGFGVKRCSIMI